MTEVTNLPYRDGVPFSTATPFTYREGATVLQLIRALKDWAGKVVPELNDALNAFWDQYLKDHQAILDNIIDTKDDWQALFDQFMVDVVAQLETLNDQAVASLVGNPVSQLRLALDAVYATKSVEDAALVQSQLYGKFFDRLRTGVPVTVACRGDSTTYGHDTVSADRVPADPNPTPNGSTHVQTRVPEPYPRVLEKRLREIFGSSNVSVLNQGFSGDTASTGYSRWNASQGQNLTLISYGINDANLGVSVESYVANYEKAILREINSFNSAVVILTPFKQRSHGPSTKIDAYRMAISSMANKYGIPVVDAEPWLGGYGTEVFSDATHMNSKGYEIIGTRAASLFIGNGPAEVNHVSSGSSLSVRPTLDNVFYGAGSTPQNDGVIVGSLPENNDGSRGIYARMINSAIYYSFYSDVDDLIIAPTMSVFAEAKLDIELDFGITQPSSISNEMNGNVVSYSKRAPSKTSSGVVPANLFVTGNDTYKYSLRVVSRGWHTLKISTEGEGRFWSMRLLQSNLFYPPRIEYTPTMADATGNLRYSNDGGEIVFRGEVHLSTTELNSWTTLFTLPADRRPGNTQYFSAVKISTSLGFGVVRVSPNGLVELYHDTLPFDYSLNGVRFIVKPV